MSAPTGSAAGTTTRPMGSRPEVDQAAASGPGRSRRLTALLRMAGLVVGLVLLLLTALASLRFGAIPVSTHQVWQALFDNTGTWEQTAVLDWRLSRTVIAVLVGCGLAVSGAVTQGMTRNPMADPFILGVSSGAAFGVTLAVYYGQLTSPSHYIWFSFAGAVLASGIVYGISSGGRDGGSPIRMILSGVVTAILMGTWTSVIIYTSDETRERMATLLIGSVAGRPLDQYWVTFPFIVVGTGACLLLGHQLNVLNLGEDAARAVGMNTARTRLVFTALVVMVAGATVAAAGPIGFVGLIVPHMVRAVTGSDYRWVLAYSAVFGAILLIVADLVGRVLLRPEELDAGIVMAALGAPFFIALARRRGGST